MKKFYRIISSLFAVAAVVGLLLDNNAGATVDAIISVAYAVLSAGEHA